MNRITPTLDFGNQGPEVANLHDALVALLERAAILPNEADARQELLTLLQDERAQKLYGEITGKIVGTFQEERELDPQRVVDEPTADALNELLSELGLLDEAAAPQAHIVSGAVRREDGRPLPGVPVRAFHEDGVTIRLGEDTTDADGRYTIRYEPLPGGEAVNLRIAALSDDGRTLQASELVQHARPLETINLVTPILEKPAAEQRIEGTIVLEHGVPADGLKLRLYRRDFGGKAVLLDETSTLEGGQYAFTYDPEDKALSLEVRTVNENGEEIPLSKPLNNVSREPRAVLNLIAPAALQPLDAEYRRLSDDLTPHLGEMSKLAEAKENDEQQDLTVLNRATGWDARLIALAAITERLTADPEVELPQEAVYGLLRAGLPSDKLLLAQVEPDVTEQALKTVRDAGIVQLSDAQTDAFKTAFTTFRNTVRLNLPTPGSQSTYGDLLKSSGLPRDAQDTFAPLYLDHRGTADELWENAREAGLDEAQISTLRLQGKLAFLVGNSEAMTGRVLGKQIDDPAKLVEEDLHRSDEWVKEVLRLSRIPFNRLDNLTDADKKKLNALIPAAYAAEDIEGRLNAYTEDMARKVRLSYPTQVVGRLMETDQKFGTLAANEATVTLLKNAADQGFRLGETPLNTFLRDHDEVLESLSAFDAQAARQQLQTVQRVYQITPTNEAMPVLMNLGMTSAHDVTAYAEAEFIDLYEATYLDLYEKTPPRDEPQLVYRKAKQVSSVTYNLFTIARKLDSEPPVAGLSAPVEVREDVRNELIKHFPTMESLFGSMDFCECEHCRSVLSPAAYLVDLLQFVDPEPGVWDNFLTRWKATHGGEDYPHQDADGNAMKPYDVLIERRPDLPHIPLTCENTHTALPYIDVVNEILEYYVAHGKLEEAAAHDTGAATTEELLAEPQNVIREAYDDLLEADYPLNLPFDLWIETVRQFCNFSETPLDQVLETFRQSDALFAPTQPFDRASIFMEELALSPAEAALFTDPDPLSDWHELYGFDTEAEATTEAIDPETDQRIDLHSAKALSRRLGVTFKEIAEIVQTGFVNPRLNELALLYKLGVTIQDARFYQEHKLFHEDNKDLIGQDRSALSPADQQRFDELSNEVPDTGMSGWEVVNEVAAFEDRLNDLATSFDTPLDELEAFLEDLPFGEILVLADPDAGCNFDRTTLQYADATEAKAIDFLRINLFVRVWRKLGWRIEETDRALSTFVPHAAPFDEDPENLKKQPLETALIYLAHLKALDEKVRVGKQSRLKLLTLWSDIATTGKKPLYAQLFLTRSVLESAPVFDHPSGEYLTDPTIKLADHVLALQGALGLTADEIGRILEDNNESLESAELSLANVSLLYRHRLLAKVLKLSMRELITLKQLSGLDPFKPLHPEPLETIEEDHPFSHTLRFVEIAEEVKESGLTIEALDYLLRHRFDEAGTYRSDPDETLALLKTLAEGVRAIRAEHAIPDDPGTLTEGVLRQTLGLALPPDVVERFLAMMNDTVEFTATRRGVEPADEQLEPEAFADEERIRGLNYQEVPHKEQKLTFRGVLFDVQKTELLTRFDGVLTAPQKPVFADLLDGVQQQARSFFEKHLQKQAPDAQPAYGFLDAADFDVLFAPLPEIQEDLTEEEKTAARKAIEQQRKNTLTLLGEGFFPFLQQRLIHQFIVETMTAHTDADPALVESLVTDERLLAVADSKPLLASFAATGERGVNATFFDSDDLSGAAQAATATVRSADTTLNPLNLTNSAQFEGYLEVPTPGAYRFYIELDEQDAEAELRFDHLPDPVFLNGTAAADNTTLGDQPDEFVELKPGIPYRFSLTLERLDGGGARLLVQGETLPKDGVSQLTLYPISAMDGAGRAILLLTKALHLVERLDLSEREIRYLLTHTVDFGGVNLRQLPTQSVGDTPAENDAATERFTGFLRLAAYARLKHELAGGTDDLIGIFEANGAGDLNSVYPLIARLTRRDEATVKAAAEALVTAPSFENEKPLQRLWEALQIVERFGVPVASLLEWTRIVIPAVTPAQRAQRFEIARDLKEAIKARFEPEAWQRVAQPIFDRLRQRQRDALATHVMHQHGFDRLEQLYEHFLIDPGMEPVVQTSRIRLAIASLQLFIQRCLLNLERKVNPSTINSRHWEWMKRYRVWEANRKIFLFPENWLEPEFRDDKTHLFGELEGALLQGDVSSDLAEDAFLNYLKKLDELARLDIVAMHIEDDPDPIRRTLHVFGRTYSLPHKYFYRRYAHQMWTPWEPVSAEIEGNHLVPVVWRDRLYLFWVTFMDKPDENAQPDTSSGGKKLAEVELSAVMSDVKAAGKKKQVDVQLHWSEYLHGEWSTRESGGFMPVFVSTWIPPHWERPRVGETRPISSNGFVWVEATELPVPLRVPLSYDYNSVFVHVSKEPYEDDEELGVKIHLKGPKSFQFSFYLAGRNSKPEKTVFILGPAHPYSSSGVRATRYSGSGPLKVTFRQRISTSPGEAATIETPSILQQGSRFTLLPCDNTLTLGVSEDAFRDAENPGAVLAALEKNLGEIAALTQPVYYQDDRHTLFVEPDLTERTIEEWQEWVTPTPRPDPGWQNPAWWKDLILIPEKPRKVAFPDLKDVASDFEIDARSVIKPKPDRDWLINPVTVLEFDQVLISAAGQPGLQIASGGIPAGSTPINVDSGGGPASGGAVVLADITALDQSGLVDADAGLNVVGNAGFNSALAHNFEAFTHTGFGAAVPGTGRIGR